MKEKEVTLSASRDDRCDDPSASDHPVSDSSEWIERYVKETTRILDRRVWPKDQ